MCCEGLGQSWLETWKMKICLTPDCCEWNFCGERSSDFKTSEQIQIFYNHYARWVVERCSLISSLIAHRCSEVGQALDWRALGLSAQKRHGSIMTHSIDSIDSIDDDSIFINSFD